MFILPRSPLAARRLVSTFSPLRSRLSYSASSRSASNQTSNDFPPKAVAAAIAAGILVPALTVYYLDSRSAVHRYVITPILRYACDPETSHKIAVKVLGSGLAPRDVCTDDEALKTKLWDEELSNPIGIAAGFDKNGEAVDGLLNLGFGWVEIGSVTPKPQPGNLKPRVFHLPEDLAIINRYGFPSDGSKAMLSRLRARLPGVSAGGDANASLRPNALLAINLGKNKSSPLESIDDFLKGIRTFAPYADVLVVNVSSPNTPGLRGLQTRARLEELLKGIAAERDALPLSEQFVTARRPRLVLKISPDLTDEELKDIAEVVTANSGIDGVIVSNTTVQRPSIVKGPHKSEMGGLSGTPLKPITLHVLRTLRTHLPYTIPIIGCGGIMSGADALEYARAGACAVQLYTGFGYDGVGACRRIKDELAEELKREGTTWDAIVQRAVKGLSASSPGLSGVKNDAGGSNNIQALIGEAQALKQQLDALATVLENDSQFDTCTNSTNSTT